jgi:hypothetical protein
MPVPTRISPGSTQAGYGLARAGLGEQCSSGTGGDQAGGDNDPHGQVLQQHALGQRGDHGDRHHHRQERDAGHDRRVAQHTLEVTGQEQEQREYRRVRQEERQVGGATVAVGDHPQRDERVADDLLEHDEAGQQHAAGDERGQCDS